MAATAKSLQLCLTLCDPIDGSLPGHSVPGISAGKSTAVGCHFLLQCMKVKSESEVAQSCPTLRDPMDCSMPGLPVLHYLPEFALTHVHWVGDAIQPSYPVVPFSFCPQSFAASGSFQMSQFFTSGGQSIGVSASISVLPMHTQDWSPLGWNDWISFQSKGLLRVFSNTTVQKHQFFCAQLSL